MNKNKIIEVLWELSNVVTIVYSMLLVRIWKGESIWIDILLICFLVGIIFAELYWHDTLKLKMKANPRWTLPGSISYLVTITIIFMSTIYGLCMAKGISILSLL